MTVFRQPCVCVAAASSLTRGLMIHPGSITSRKTLPFVSAVSERLKRVGIKAEEEKQRCSLSTGIRNVFTL